MNEKFTILINSCDKYSDLWLPFFTLLKKNWPSVSNYQVVLNTETLSYSFDGINIKTYPATQDETWSARLKRNLKNIKTDYVLFLLDDFFIETEVDEKTIFDCVKYLDQNKDVLYFGFVPTLWDNITDNRFSGFEKRKRITNFRVTTQAGLWRRKELLALIRKHESPWDFETFASIRSRLRYGEYYVAKRGTNYAFNYDFDHGGAVHRGGWTKHAEKLLKDNNLSVDISIRGYDLDPAVIDNVNALTPQEKTFLGRLKIRATVLLKHWKSLI